MPGRRPFSLPARFAPLGAAVAAFGVMLLTISRHLLFGDAAESVAGVASFGILHAPGYATYVVLAKLFSLVVPIGELPLRLALFSAACAAGSVGLLVATARRLGFSWWGALASGAALTTGLSFLFYATYAKSYAPTALAIALLCWLALRWTDTGRVRDLALFAAVAGLSSGLSYQIVATAGPGLLILALARRRPNLRQWGAALAAGLLTLAAVWGFTLVRARAEPAYNYGGASTFDRLQRLALMKDFGVGEARPQVRPPSQSSTPNLTDAGADEERRPRATFAARLLSLGPMVANELGLAAAVLAAGGAAALLADPRRRLQGLGLAAIALGNAGVLALVVFNARLNASDGAAFRYGGFFFATYIAVALLAGAGADAVAQLAARRVEQQRRRRVVHIDSRRFVLTGGVCLVLVVAFAVANVPAASHAGPAFAEGYASDMLDSLPRRAVLFTWRAERNFPLLAEQLADHRRPDVDVVLVEWILSPWYREQLSERVGLDLPDRTTRDWFDETVALAKELEGRRPVYLDLGAWSFVVDKLPARQEGLVARVLPDGQPGVDAAKTAAALQRSHVVGIYDAESRFDWPERTIVSVYSTAHLLLARQLRQDGDEDAARASARLALRVSPTNDAARQFLASAPPRG